jgi:hypothetical protein
MPFFEAVRWHPQDCAGGLRSTLLTLCNGYATQAGTIGGGRAISLATAEVLRNRRPRELEPGTAWPAQSQPAEPQDTLQMRKQHLDTFPVAAW